MYMSHELRQTGGGEDFSEDLELFRADFFGSALGEEARKYERFDPGGEVAGEASSFRRNIKREILVARFFDQQRPEVKPKQGEQRRQRRLDET